MYCYDCCLHMCTWLHTCGRRCCADVCLPACRGSKAGASWQTWLGEAAGSWQGHLGTSELVHMQYELTAPPADNPLLSIPLGTQMLPLVT